MARDSNVFHNLVTGENSTTELLCNLMRFNAFRRPLLARFFGACAGTIAFDDIDTQGQLKELGIPDVKIKNDQVCAFIEVKVTQNQGLTQHQPHSYFLHLKDKEDHTLERWLVFLVPKNWSHLSSLNSAFKTLGSIHGDCGVNTRVVYWEDVLDVIEESDLQLMNPFLGAFNELLAARYRPPKIVFSAKELKMLFSTTFPNALCHIEQLVTGVRGKSSAYKSRVKNPNSLCPDEYGLYFKNGDQEVLWFGVLMDFWNTEGKPLCFGVSNEWEPRTRDAFLDNYKGKKKLFQKWTLGWIDEETLADETGEGQTAAIEQIWILLSPLLEAATRGDA